jgi:hypothetical protein
MVVAMSREATAAILGAVAGGGIAIVGQALFGIVGAFRARRVAAQIIYAELVGNYANASAAAEGFGWSSTKPAALRSAWDAYGARLLLPFQKAHDIGTIASAYNRIDDVAWLATHDTLDPSDALTKKLIEDIQTGLYVAARRAGYSDREATARGINVAAVRIRIEAQRAAVRATRRRWWRKL